MKKALFAIMFFIALQPKLRAAEQSETLTLKKCIEIGLENSANIRKAKLEKMKSEYKVDEALSNGLPQIDGFIQSMDNVKKSVMLLPGEMLGTTGTVALEYGTQYSTSAGIKVNQLLYSQTYFLSLSVSRKLDKLNALNLEKAKDDIIYDITKIYSLASITSRQIKITETNIARIDSVIEITKALVENGYAKSVDLDRAVVGKSNLKIQLDNTIALYQQQLDMMKYYIDLPADKKIELNDSVGSLMGDKIDLSQKSFDSRKEIKLLELQKDLYGDNLQAVKYAYLPTLAFFGQVQTQNQREDMKLFGTKWYPTAYIGLNLSVPIFDGFNKHSKIQQAELDLNKAEIDLSDTKSYFNEEFEKANRNYNNNTVALSRQKENVDLAEKILDVSKIKLREGSISMSDLLNDESNLSGAEQNYLNTKLQLIFSELDILKSIGKIDVLLNN